MKAAALTLGLSLSFLGCGLQTTAFRLPSGDKMTAVHVGPGARWRPSPRTTIR